MSRAAAAAASSSKDDTEMRDDTNTPDDDSQTNNTNADESGADEPASKKAKGPGKKKAAKADEVVEVDPNYPNQRFHLGELIYANYADGKQWFPAKVLKIEKRGELIYYYLHYQGWGDKYNDWRPYHKDAELMKFDEEGTKIFEESKQKMKELKAKGGKVAAPPADDGKKKKRKHDDDDTIDEDVQVGGASGEVKLKISGFLKKQLIADWEAVTRQHKLVTLPRPTTVHALLQEFEQSKAKQESSLAMCKEVVNGIEQYFEKALGTVLLYRFERPQFKAQLAKLAANGQGETAQLANVYGAEHLLRLFVKLPGLLAYTKLETKEAVVLGSKLNEFIKWLDKKAQGGGLFQKEYEATDKEYAQQANESTE